MAVVIGCPNEQTLQRFLLGHNTPEEAATLEAHLETCEHCVARFSTLHTDDSLVEAMRCRNSAVVQTASEGDGLLAEWLKRLCPAFGPHVDAPAEKPAGEAPTVNATPAHPDGGDTTITYAFLSPSQNPHELGQLGHYQVRKVLGSGGMGVVFQAYDPDLQRLVALKTTLPKLAENPSAKQRFLREARAAAAIKHDHIVTIYHVGEDHGIAYLAMEFLEGESLDHRLHRQGRLPWQEALRIARESAQGLAVAHKHGLIHRDIKPGNIWLESRGQEPGTPGLLDSAGRVKILDFGLALPTADDAHLTQSGAIVGTPAFMAPEQFRGQTVDARSDLFSLGCVLYRMATGEPPFRGAHSISTLIAIATTNPRPPQELNPELPPAVCDLIQRMLAKNPTERPPSATAVIETIQAIEQSRATPARPVRHFRKPIVWAMTAAVLACALGSIGYWNWPALQPYGPHDTSPAARNLDPALKAVIGAGKGPKQCYADLAHALEGVLDHRDIACADADALHRWRTSLGPDFRLAFLSTRQGSGPVLFNAVAVREKTPRLARFRARVPEDAIKKTWDMMRDDGFRLLSLSLQNSTDAKVNWTESQLWVHDDGKFTIDGGSLAELIARLKEQRAEGFRPFGLDAASIKGGARFTSSLSLIRDRLWETELSLSADELLTAVKAYRDRGWRPDVLTPYFDNSRLRFMLVAIGNDEGPDWRFRMDMTLEQLNQESSDQRSQGLFPLTIVSYGNDADLRCAAIWVRCRAPGTPPPQANSVPDRAAKSVSWASAGPMATYKDGAHALSEIVDFRGIVKATAKELSDWHDKLDPKFRLALVTSRQSSAPPHYAPPQYNAVAVQELNPIAARFHLEITSEGASEAWNKNGADGFRPIASCGNIDPDKKTWNGTQLWVKDGNGQRSWYGWMPNVTSGNKDGRTINYRPIYMAATMSPEGLGCTTTLAPDHGRAWEVFYNLTPDELPSTIEFYRRKGWRPDVVVPYTEDDQQRTMLVVVDNSDQIDWHFQMDMTPGDYEKKSAERRRQGFYPLSLASHGDDANVRYTAVWVRFRAPVRE